MPYIITTTTPETTIPAHEIRGSDVALIGHAVTRTAVATLDEARDVTIAAITAAGGRAPVRQTWRKVADDGGTVGPLPDGTVIEVRPMSYEDIDSIPDGSQLLADGDSAELIAAYNAR